MILINFMDKNNLNFFVMTILFIKNKSNFVSWNFNFLLEPV